MGRDLSALQMRTPPQTILRSYLSTNLRVRTNCSTFLPTQSRAFLSSCPALALKSTEAHERNYIYRRNGEKIRSFNLLEIPVDKPLVGFEYGDEKRRVIWYSERLRNCAAELCLIKGKMVHGCLVRSGTEPDMHLWVSLINFYAKCGALESAARVFEQMPFKDVVAWTALISGFVAHGSGIESVELFCKMRREGVRPNEFTLATVLKGCLLSSDLEFGKQLHGDVVKSGVLSDVYIGSILIDLYAKGGEMEYAYNVFCLMPERNSVLWNALLNGYAQVGDGKAVLHVFCQMEEPETRFSSYTLSIVLKGIAGSGGARTGKAVHSIVIKVGAQLDDFVSCSLLNMYSKCGMASDALKVFKTIKNPDLVAWSSIISVLDQEGEKESATKLFQSMRRSGTRPNQFTLASLVSAATDLDNLYYGESIHAYAHKCGLDSDHLVSNALIAMYMKFRSINEAYLIFNNMTYWDVVSWNSLLSGFHDEEITDQGIGIFKRMLEEGFQPNMYTFISILRSCSSQLNINFGKQVHARIIKDDLMNHGYVGTALLDMYAKCGSMEYVETIFNRLKEKDVFAWTVLISGYSQTNQGEKAAHCFNLMRREGVVPNEFTLASCLRGSSGIVSLENGRLLHSLAFKAGQSSDVFVASALVDMYAKCGYIEDAETLFNGLSSLDTVLWNTIICGYSQHGEGDKAFQAFDCMINQGVLPDGITFIGILSACSHLGLDEEGRSYFNMMKERYGIAPSIEHYACMVDILGRAKKFDEVESLIERMDLNPNALIWENVLAACKLHGNVELGERAAENLFRIDPEADSNYILLSNLYASGGRWNDVSKVRETMTSKGIKKEPGCSWVEVDAQTHVFLSQDDSHSRLRDIHLELEKLSEVASEAGYVPDTKHVLHNVSEKEKRQNLLHHSERLALAFALINNVGSNRKVRIFKNLRICGDCHEFMKIVSGNIDREIVVRDVSRFHHFRNGSCSCNDYW